MTRDQLERTFHAQLKGFTTKPQQGRIMDAFRRVLRELVVDVMLTCPKCGQIHIDAPEPITPGPDEYPELTAASRWTNPPHRSHLCHHCGCVWRPCDINTNGVARATTRGTVDTWPEPVEDKGYWIQGGRKHYVGPAVQEYTNEEKEALKAVNAFWSGDHKP